MYNFFTFVVLLSAPTWFCDTQEKTFIDRILCFVQTCVFLAGLFPLSIFCRGLPVSCWIQSLWSLQLIWVLTKPCFQGVPLRALMSGWQTPAANVCIA